MSAQEPKAEKGKSKPRGKRRSYQAEYLAVINYCQANLDLLEDLNRVSPLQQAIRNAQTGMEYVPEIDPRIQGRIDALKAIIGRLREWSGEMSDVRDAEIVSNLPALRERSSVLLAPVMDVNTAKARLLEFQEFCAHYLEESKDGGNDGGDFGIIPGAGKKKILLKSGADKLCEIYGLYDEYVIISSVEDWERGLFDYVLKCILKSRRDDSMVGAGVGSCSSFESKYRWREAKRKCPACGKETIIKGKAEYGGGFICWKKEGKSDGCNAKFKDTDSQIIDQVQGRVENPDIVDTKNTVLKMAKKRAKIDAVIGVTRSSGIFSQDLDDIAMPAPTKPPVPVTTEDIPLDIPGRGNTAAVVGKGTAQTGSPDGGVTAGGVPTAAEVSGGIPETPATPKPAAKKAAPKSEEPEYPGCIDKPRKIAFARAWKDALHPSLHHLADKLRHEWEGRQGYVDENGNPTSAKIPLKDFESVKRDAVAWAKQIPGLAEKTLIDDSDVPF